MERLWIKKIKRSANEEAANKLITKYYNEIYAFIYKQTLDNELTLDLTQEIFISVLKSIQHFDSKKASFRTWLYRLASNRLVDYFRSKSYQYTKVVQPIEEYEFQDEQNIVITLEYKEDFETVISLLTVLDATSQQIVRLKLFGEYTFQEIEAIVSIPLSTVKTKYYASIKGIRRAMKEDLYE
ncbi:sigma-70 family RNA polymerase sigma factor [Psychrobacillus sp.]|uniref:RNA polymerase sigma factor n=1 Tax=Psychrobacillus sp. TaxID=1871623 RepID=UPI0028BD826C|nr:sigma-70 family RNA polymerase sigma factor [Psychrobacillus sp.]